MLIFGIDPGTATTGYGVLEVTLKNGKSVFKTVDYGCVVTSSEVSMPQRLEKLHYELTGLLKNFKPDIVAIERLFFFSNAKTVISVGQARGVVMLAAAQEKVEVCEYAPLQIKSKIVGYGRAKKKEVQKEIKKKLGIKNLKLKAGNKSSDGYHIDDAADALAVAFCHFLHCESQSKPIEVKTKKPILETKSLLSSQKKKVKKTKEKKFL